LGAAAASAKAIFGGFARKGMQKRCGKPPKLSSDPAKGGGSAVLKLASNCSQGIAT
jgi:hypothetical protein